MLLTIGLLIVPSAFHRIADRGESTGRTRLITGRCAAVGAAAIRRRTRT